MKRCFVTSSNDEPANTPSLLAMGTFSDERGLLWHLNEFNVRDWVRMYFISNSSDSPSRGWHGHVHERKAFMAVSGEFEVSLVHKSFWDLPDGQAQVETFHLTASKPSLLIVPGGYANRLTQLRRDSRALVLSDSSLEKSKADDIRFPLSRWGR
jgi:dTDP-4-dehydrorhamnose 3,5-epimerase